MTNVDTQFLSDSEDDLNTAAALLKAGGTVAVPTETVYGLAANALDVDAVNKIFSAKQRPNNHPLIVHIHDKAQLESLAVDLPPQLDRLAQAFWPGPLTVIVKKRTGVPDAVTGGLNTVGIRMPNHPVLRQVLKIADVVVAAPSANPHKQLSPTSAQQVFNELNGRIDAVIDGGFCNVGVESTIVDLSNLNAGQQPRVLRAGPITAQQIEQVLNEPVIPYQSHNESVAGNIKQHYQPKRPLSVKSSQDLIGSLPIPAHNAVVYYSDDVERAVSGQSNAHKLSESKAEYARMLYRTLYELDTDDYQAIWVESPPDTEEWLDIHDRLARASAK